jgi:5-formyltetrahydrofolate cyclo-ligase
MSAAVASRLVALPAFAAARVLLAYRAIGAEVDVAALVADAADAGVTVLFPGGDPTEWITRDDVPVAPAIFERDDSPAVILVPGLGFDVTGTRLGRGRGFYDRVLAALRVRRRVVALGTAFEVQVVPRLPRETWDQRVDVVVTERRVIDASTTPAPRGQTEKVLGS